jgi:hypothetical protein
VTKVGRRDVPVRAELCETCIFRPGNVMLLAPGRVEGMVAEVHQRGGYIPCHESMHRRKRGLTKTVCRGLYDHHPELPVFQLAVRLADGLAMVDENDNVVGRETRE